MTAPQSETATPEASRRYYDAFAPGYEDRRHHGYHLMVDELQGELVLEPARGAAVLEVGCGTGLILERIAPVARRAVGVDLSPGMLERARGRGLAVTLGCATELPFADATFDLCYSFKVLSHVPELARAFAEMARVTRPGGRVFLEVYNRRSLRWLLRRLRGARTVAPGIDESQVFTRFYRPAEVRALLPPELRLLRLHGIRVLTVLPGSVSWPLLGPLLRWSERRLRSGLLAGYGGFLVLECECHR